MNPNIITVIDQKRGCGWRKNGATYLRCDVGDWMSCGMLPVPIDKPCPVCGHGIRITRGLQKVDWAELTKDIECKTPSDCAFCLAHRTQYAWLMSVGEKFYKTPGDFTREALEQGISKRVHAIPHGFKVGESVVLLCHKKAVTEWHDVEVPLTEVNWQDPNSLVARKRVPVSRPGVFSVFKPSRVEYVCKGNESDEDIERLLKRGFTPVQVVHAEMKRAELIEGESLEEHVKPDAEAQLMAEAGVDPSVDELFEEGETDA